MKILILTQIVDKNDSNLGFFHEWIIEFAKHFKTITVICLKKGDYDFPDNVSVLSLGKESGESKIKYIVNFYKYIWQERKNYDAVFIHMTQLYVIMGGIIWKILSKKIYLWYAHGKTNVNLKIATLLSNKIFSSSKEGFKINTGKLNIVGQGIDTNIFKKQIAKNNLVFITTGRISKIKNIKLLVEVFNNLPDLKLKIIGDPITPEDMNYYKECADISKSNIEFLGKIPHNEIPRIYQECSYFISASQTGSIDKAVLEAISCGLTPLVSNDAFRSIFTELKEEVCFIDMISIESYTKKIKEMLNIEKDILVEKLSSFIEENHSLVGLIEKISKKMI